MLVIFAESEPTMCCGSSVKLSLIGPTVATKTAKLFSMGEKKTGAQPGYIGIRSVRSVTNNAPCVPFCGADLNVSSFAAFCLPIPPKVAAPALPAEIQTLKRGRMSASLRCAITTLDGRNPRYVRGGESVRGGTQRTQGCRRHCSFMWLRFFKTAPLNSLLAGIPTSPL